jgi:tetratricopeptide (TPR) repeat protein
MVADRPWMILATARSEFSCDWADHADLVHLPVTGLPDAVCAEICAAIDQEGRLAPRHVAAIVARCDGNPLFVEEVVRATCEALAESGEAGDVALNAVPATLQDGLVSRLDRLGPAREVATVAAAAGREVDHGLLALVLDMPSRSLREGLRNLSREGILEVEGVPPSSRYRFRHALIRDAAYGLLGTRAREAVHLRLAEALPLHAPDVAQRDPASLAGHLESAGHLARALPLWAAAASAAAAAGAHQEAAARYRAALSLLDRMEPGSDSPARRLELLAGLIVSLGAVDGWASAEVKALLDEARALFGSVGSASPPFPVLRGFVSFFIMAADHGSAATMAERCTAIATRTGSPEQLVNAHTSTGYLRWVAGDLQRARSELETAVSIYTGNESARATTMAAQDQLIQALGPLIDILRVTGEDAQALSRRQQLAEHLQRLGEASFNLASGRFWQAYDALGRGEAREALQLSAEGIALSERLSYRAVLYPLRFMHAAAEGLLGAPGDALAEMERMLDQTDRLGERHFRGNYLGLLAHLRAAAGQTEAALDAIDEAIAVTRAASELLILPRLLLVRAEILARAGPGEEAARTAALAEARRVAAAQGAHRLVTLADGTRGALF